MQIYCSGHRKGQMAAHVSGSWLFLGTKAKAFEVNDLVLMVDIHRIMESACWMLTALCTVLCPGSQLPQGTRHETWL